MKKTFIIGETLLVITCVLAIIETIVFLIIEGWHYQALSEIELILDAVLDISFTVASMMILIPSYTVIRTLITKTNILNKPPKEVNPKNN